MIGDVDRGSGTKYLRVICGVDKYSGNVVEVNVDVYCVLEAYAVNCSAVSHAVKKLLCAGLRGKGDRLQDLREARDAISRAITLEINRSGVS